MRSLEAGGELGQFHINVDDLDGKLGDLPQAWRLTFPGAFFRFEGTMAETVKDEIIEQLDKLGTPQQRQVLEFARGLATSAGVSGDKLLQFAGAIDPADLETISRAILEGCEHVDLNAW